MYIVGADETKLNTYRCTVPNSTMITLENHCQLNEQAKDRLQLFTFMASDDWQAKGILLTSILQEMLTGDAHRQ